MASRLPPVRLTRLVATACALTALSTLAACSGDGGTDPPPPSFSLGGTITGLPSGATGLVLADGSTKAQIASSGTSFTFGSLAAGSSYSVAVNSSPAGLSCTVAGGSGTLTADVDNVVVTCSDLAFTLGGTIALAAGSSSASVMGLVLANGTDSLSVPTGATAFTMPTAVTYTSSYQVTVQSQPNGMSCAVVPATASPMPAQNVTTIVVTCTDHSFTLGGTIAGLGSVTGLVLTNEAADATTIPANATTFTMNTAVPYGAVYDVAVSFHPSGFGCTVASGAGTMPANAVGSVSVSCALQVPQLEIPFGVATDAAANVYVADPGQPQVVRIAAGTGVYTTLGSGFMIPVGIAVDTSGNVYVADIGTSTITEIAAGTNTMTTIGSGFSSPWGVAVDASGNLYVADTGNNVVKEIAAGTRAITTLGSGFNGPEGVAVDASGNVYVSDTGNNVVKEIAAGTRAITTLGSGFNGPEGVAVDASGNVYVGDYNNNAVKRIAAGTGVITTLSSDFDLPAGVAVDTKGNVYVADSYDGAMREFVQANGALITL
jgi:sugar lactone lactonase YvrE